MRGLGAFELNTMEISTDWAATGNVAIIALTTAIISTASLSDKYTINVTFFLSLLQLHARGLSLSIPVPCVLGCA